MAYLSDAFILFVQGHKEGDYIIPIWLYIGLNSTSFFGIIQLCLCFSYQW